MVNKIRDSTKYLAFLAFIIIILISVLYLLIIYKVILYYLIQASDLIAVIVSSILTYAVVIIYTSIYNVEKSQKSINEEIKEFQERQVEIINKQTKIWMVKNL